MGSVWCCDNFLPGLVHDLDAGTQAHLVVVGIAHDHGHKAGHKTWCIFMHFLSLMHGRLKAIIDLIRLECLTN